MIAEQAVAQATQYEPVFIKQPVAAKRLGISVRELRRWICERRLRAYRPSVRVVLIEWAEVERLVRSSQEQFGKE